MMKPVDLKVRPEHFTSVDEVAAYLKDYEARSSWGVMYHPSDKFILLLAEEVLRLRAAIGGE